MKLLIFGATGRTGREIVRQAIEKGYHVTAFARNPNSLQVSDKNFSVVTGDILDKEQVTKAMKGQDAVISVLGNKTSQALRHANTVISEGVKNILEGMKANKVKRLLFVTSFGVSEHIFLPEKLFIRLFLKNIFADIPRQEQLIKISDIDWTIVRPARLISGKQTENYKVGTDLSIGLFSKIARSDVADFLLKSISDQNTIKKIITLQE